MVIKLDALDISLIALFATLTTIGAYFQIPLLLVPITLQTLFTYLSGTLLGGRRGALSQLIYVLMGTLGLPVYAGGKAGITHLFGPTGGFLIGFIVGSYVIGVIIKNKETPGYIDFLLAIVFGTLIIYASGISVLYYFVRGSLKVLISSIIPFLPGDGLKILLASYISYKCRPTVKLLLPRAR